MEKKKNKPHTRPNSEPQLEAVRDYYLNANARRPVVLTETQEAYRQRLVAVWTLLCRFHSDEQVKVIHMKNYKISIDTAYRDIRNAISLFGDVRNTEKEGRRHILYEWCVRTWQMAADKGDHKSMNRALENMIKLMGLDKDAGDAPNFEELQPSMVVTALPEGMEQSILAMLGGGAINLNKIPDLETIDYETAESEPGAGAAKGN
jgi:hypothetical protein